MYALITGASSGIGYEFAKVLDKEGYNLILVARRLDKLNELKASLLNEAIAIEADLSVEDNIYKLFDEIKDYDINLVINNAGFGECGYILNTDINKELNMIDLNIKALYLITKKCLGIMKCGKILNVASIAGILPSGPYMAQYYATKAYVRSFSKSIAYELKKEKSKVSVHTLCPGPVKTEFDKNANVVFSLKGMSVSKCVKYAYKKLKRGKEEIIPGFSIRFATRLSKICPNNMQRRIVAKQQKRKVSK